MTICLIWRLILDLVGGWVPGHSWWCRITELMPTGVAERFIIIDHHLNLSALLYVHVQAATVVKLCMKRDNKTLAALLFVTPAIRTPHCNQDTSLIRTLCLAPMRSSIWYRQAVDRKIRTWCNIATTFISKFLLTLLCKLCNISGCNSGCKVANGSWWVCVCIVFRVTSGVREDVTQWYMYTASCKA